MHVPQRDKDDFLTFDMCPSLSALSDKQDEDGYTEKVLGPKYKDFIHSFAENLGFDPATFTVDKELEISDGIYAHWFDRRPTPQLNDSMILTMEDLELDDSNHEMIGNNEVCKTYTTGIARSIVHEFDATVTLDKAGNLDDLHRRRFFYYSDHDTGILAFAGAFKYTLPRYPPFAF